MSGVRTVDVWRDYSGDDDGTPYSVSLADDDGEVRFFAAYATEDAARDRAIREAEKRGIEARCEIHEGNYETILRASRSGVSQ